MFFTPAALRFGRYNEEKNTGSKEKHARIAE